MRNELDADADDCGEDEGAAERNACNTHETEQLARDKAVKQQEDRTPFNSRQLISMEAYCGFPL